METPTLYQVDRDDYQMITATLEEKEFPDYFDTVLRLTEAIIIGGHFSDDDDLLDKAEELADKLIKRMELRS